MSVAQVKFYCTNCGFEATYQAMNKVPRLCPQCNRDSRPRYAWLRKKTPFLPAAIFLGLLFSLGFYDQVVTKAEELLWLPFVVFGLVFFSLPWMLVTLLKDWPKLPKGPHTICQIKWLRQDACPQDIVGLKTSVILEGHFPRKKFQSTVEGFRPTLMDLKGRDDDLQNDRVYILKKESNSLETGQLLFHPNWVQFKRGEKKRLSKHCGGAFSYSSSLEELLLNKEGPFSEVYGMFYWSQNPDTLAKPRIPYSLLTVMNSAYGRVKPARNKQA